MKEEHFRFSSYTRGPGGLAAFCEERVPIALSHHAQEISTRTFSIGEDSREYAIISTPPRCRRVTDTAYFSSPRRFKRETSPRFHRGPVLRRSAAVEIRESTRRLNLSTGLAAGALRLFEPRELPKRLQMLQVKPKVTKDQPCNKTPAI
jgi:hypothetical protein